MDTSALMVIVDRHMPEIRELLCLGHWRISAEYSRIDGRGAAQCWPDVDYDTARIVFDSDKFSGDEEQIIRIIVHELAHIIEAPFDLYENAALRLMEEHGLASTAQVMKTIGTHAHEQMVLNIERIWRECLEAVYLERMTGPAA